jgi:hypothetical protein
VAKEVLRSGLAQGRGKERLLASSSPGGSLPSWPRPRGMRCWPPATWIRRRA